MSTRATYTFGYVETNVKTKKHAQFDVFHNLKESKLDAFLDNETVTVYKHHDGYPTGALQFINNMLLELLDDYKTIGECKQSPKTLAKYFLKGNKDNGLIELTLSYRSHGDLDYRYHVFPDFTILVYKRDCQDIYPEKLIFKGTLKNAKSKFQST